MTVDVGGISYSVDIDTGNIIRSTKEVIANSSKIGKAFSEIESSVNGVSTSMSRSASVVQNYIAAMRLEAQTVHLSAQEKELFILATKGATSEQLKEIAVLRQHINAVNSAQGSNKAFRGGIQNVGYQLQDLIVQLQMGTSAFVALGQQGPQLAGSFGPIGAVVGMFISLASVIGGAFFASMMSAATASDRLKDATEGLNAIITETDDGVQALTERVIKLAEANETAARAEISLGLVRAKDVINAASDSIANATKSVDGWTNAASSMDRAVNQLDDLEMITKRFGISSAEAFDGNIPARFQEQIEDLSAFMRTLGKEYGLTQQEALAFIQATDTFNKQRTPENAAALADMLAKVAVSSQTATPEFIKFTAEVGENSRKMTDAKDKTDALKFAQENLSAAIAKSSIAMGGNSKQLESWVVSLENSVLRGKDALKAKRDQTVQDINNNAQLSEEQKSRALKAAEDLYKIEVDDINKREALVNQRKVIKAQKSEAREEKAEAKKAEQERKKALDDRRKQLDEYYKWSTESAQRNRDLQSSVSPMASVDNSYTDQFAALNEARAKDLISDQTYYEQRNALANSYEQARMDAAEQIYKSQSDMNAFIMEGIDALGQASTSTISGLLSGTMSVTEAMQNFANVILNQAVGALVNIGIEYVKNQVLAQSMQTAAMATAAATGTAMAASYAPAAAMASLASFGANAAPAAAGISSTVATAQALALTGMRQYGGPVSASGMYRVNEGGAPEIFQSGDGKQYLMPNTRGEVVSNSDATSGSGVQWQINVINNASDMVNTTQSVDNDQRIVNLAINAVASQLSSRTGQVSAGLQRGFNVPGKTR